MSECDLTTDVLVIGGGPAGLACAWRVKQLRPDLSVTLLDKAAHPGAQLVSGAVMNPVALDELWPDWRAHLPHDETKHDIIFYLFKKFAIPLPSTLGNKGKAFIISIAQLGAALAEQAAAAGVDVLPGFAGQKLLGDERIGGVACHDGTRIAAKHTILAEGCFGNLSEDAIERFNLRGGRNQTYALGIKEIWRVKRKLHKRGTVMHSLGWPLPASVYGGGFMFHYGEDFVGLGLVTGLDYNTPTLSPYEEMQQWKTHPWIKAMLENGTRISYQARALSEGGWQSLPRCDFPGGMLIGDAAGFLDVMHMKGIHMAIWSGLLAAKAIAEETDFATQFEGSPLQKALWKARNVRPGFRFGRWIGMIHAGFQAWGGWLLPYTISPPPAADRKHYNPNARKRVYPRADGEVTFSLTSSLALSAIDPPESKSHLLLKDPSLHDQRRCDPAPFYCPAGVYEFVEGKFTVHHENCIHCKTCAIKDPDGNIVWTTPEGGSGPAYESI